MLISDILGPKGSDVVKIQTTDSVTFAVSKLAEHRIAALVVEDQWMKPAGIFTERDFVNASGTSSTLSCAMAPRCWRSMCSN